ncbi:MAG: beta-1,6-N-acetylglucosaminyltransferase [Terriglobia bacterium]
MKIAYLLVVHKNPHLLEREIRLLSSADCAFFVHIDQKSDIEEFSGIRGDNVHFSEKRIPVYWGGFSLVQAALLLLRQALDRHEDYDYFVHLHAGHYPLRSRNYIHSFLEQNRGLEFISMVELPNEAAGQSLFKINRPWVRDDWPLLLFFVKVLGRLRLVQRDYKKHLGSLEPFAGSASWALTRDACQYVLQFMESNQHVERYFRYTRTSDEMFFHTILGNSVFRSRTSRNFVYEDWSAGGAHPSMINEQHIALFEAQDKVWLDDVCGSGEALFGRKFSDDRLDLVERIDDMIRRKESIQSPSNPRARTRPIARTRANDNG